MLAGILALVAGLAAYLAGRQQAEAVNGQNRALRRSERRRLARETLIAARLLDGILATVVQNIDTILAFGSDQRDLGLHATNSLRDKLPPLTLDPVIDQIGRLNREIIDACFLLHTRIDQFRASSGGTTAAVLSQELEAIRATVSFLREETSKESNAVNAILATTGE